MKKPIFILVVFILLASPAIGQLFVHQPKLYYEYPFLVDRDGCYFYAMETDESLLHFNKEFEGYIDLKILNLQHNLIYFETDDDGFKFCPYDRERKRRVSYLSKRYRPEDKVPNEHLYDTIYVLRNEPVKTNRMSRQRRLGAQEEYPYEAIPLITSFAPEMKDSLIDVQVEFRENDFITRLGKQYILCPSRIRPEVIKAVNRALIKEGYLSDKKRGKYHGEIREALYDFQEDNGLYIGFLDKKTIRVLNIDVKFN